MLHKAIIIDDEPLAIQVLTDYIKRIDFLTLGASCRNAAEAYNELNRDKFDVMFLDINMPEMSGLDLLKTLTHRPKLIFTTAYRDYAVESYEYDALDYLVKPISFTRFLKSVQKLVPDQYRDQSQNVHSSGSAGQHIYLKSDNKIFKISVSNITYIESLKDALIVHTPEYSVTTYQSISNLAKILPSDKFLRIHRSYLIGLDKIKFFNSSTVGVGEEELPIGRTYKEGVLSTLKG